MTALHTLRRSRYVVVLASALASFVLVPALAGDVTGLAGTVRDGVGTVLEDVEVLIVPHASSIRPLAEARTDREGRFRFDRLAPGSYRIAALKQGYLTFIGDVDTRLQSMVDVVLRPRGSLDPQRAAELPAADAWALRLPRRSILRETEARPDAATDDVESVDGDETARDPLRLQIDQLFAVGSSLQGRGEGDPALHGATTDLRVASVLGERTRLQVRGRRETLSSSSTSSTGARLPGASDADAVLSVAVSYDASVDQQVTFNAFINQRDLRWAGTAVESTPTFKQEHRSWGGGASWSKQLDRASRVELAVDFQDAALQLPDELRQDMLDPGLQAAVSNRSVGAVGSYAALPAMGHRLKVDFQARLLQAPLPNFRAAGAMLAPAFDGMSGWTFGINARDMWRLDNQFSLIYGLGYKHALRTRDSALIVPQLGAAWSHDDVALSVLASWNTVADWDDGEVADPRATAFRPADALGWEAQIELPLPADIRLSGSTSYTPIQMSFDNGAGARLLPDGDTIYLTDGNAAVRQNRLALVKESGSTRTWAEVARGSAEGTLAPLLPFAIPLQDLADRDLRYTNGRVGLRFVPAGTDLMLEYRQVEERRTDDALSDPASEQRTLELRLIQDLARMSDLGSWRFLMGVSVASLEFEQTDSLLAAGNGALVEALGGRLRAGLSVEF